MRRARYGVRLGSPLLMLLAWIAAAQDFTYTPFHATGIYNVGETAGWNLMGTAPAGRYTYTIRKNNLDVLKSGAVDLTSGPASIQIVPDEPAMLYVDIVDAESQKHVALGAAISPQKLGPAVPRPADFDDFWQAKLEALSHVPIHAELTPLTGAPEGVELNTVK